MVDDYTLDKVLGKIKRTDIEKTWQYQDFDGYR